MNSKSISLNFKDIVIFLIIGISAVLFITGQQSSKNEAITSAICGASFLYALLCGMSVMNRIGKNKPFSVGFKLSWFKALTFFKIFVLSISIYSMMNIYFNYNDMFAIDKKNYGLIAISISILLYSASIGWLAHYLSLKFSTSHDFLNYVVKSIIVISMLPLLIEVLPLFVDASKHQKEVSIISGVISSLMLANLTAYVLKNDKGIKLRKTIESNIINILPYVGLCLICFATAKTLIYFGV